MWEVMIMERWEVRRGQEGDNKINPKDEDKRNVFGAAGCH